jgi:TolA-binding protein
MKGTERHHLKQNEFAVTTGKVIEGFQEHRSRIGVIAVAVVVMLLIAGGFFYWRKQQADRAGAALGIAMATAESPVSGTPTLPGVSPAGTFGTEAERSDAAIKAFTEVSANHAGTAAGVAATYHLAGELLKAGKPQEAEQRFRSVADSGSDLYAPLARLGIAEAQTSAGQYDQAIATLTDIAAARDGLVPADAVLMQLARTHLKAGKPVEARAAFKRIVDEFPTSTYLSEAQQQLDELQ